MKHLAEKPSIYSAKAETGFVIGNTSKLLIESMFFTPAGVFPRGQAGEHASLDNAMAGKRSGHLQRH